MIKALLFFWLLLLSTAVVADANVAAVEESPSEPFTWPGGAQLAVSLSYDDALNSQLDNVIPALKKHNFKASFYIVPNSPVINARMAEWRATVKDGHELGNHSMYHPCRASLPNREWVPAHHDLDSYSVGQLVEELTLANTFLKAIDGKLERTYTVPCGDLLVDGQEYLSEISHLFTAIKGHGADKRFSPIIYPEGETGEELIDYIRNASSETLLVNIVFHGVGGDYLSVSSKAHAELLAFLANNRDSFYVDSYINLMKYAANKQ
ncbi:polysaccharide deacetylase family protein [Shewanella donghaensis]|uniref:polysaccharide deacetylase family protein n=1 Tax=Shewanella donghaensis TaxID=238836 RepID=UPI00118242FA|nr:polysaccharide deacetylase family protein [Shewanella donghaensis]